VYPLPQTVIPSYGHQPAQSLTWAIAAEPNGTLVEKTTSTEVSYLYWEAIADSHLVTPNTSRATTPVGDMEAFDPSHPAVSPDESVLLPVGKVPGYLDAALKALSLHTEARNSFITLVDIGCQICSSTNTSPCVSLRRRLTRRQRGCTSRPCLTSSPVSSCFSAAFHRATWGFGRPRPHAWRRRMAQRSGRRLSESSRYAPPIVACSAFWSGAGWKLSNAHVLVMDY